MRHLPLLLLLSTFACKGGKDDADTDTDGSATDDTDPGGSDDDDTDVEEPGPATLTLYDSMTGTPNANEVVLVFDADGEFVEELETDEAGTISAEVGPGWMFVYMRRDSEDALPYSPYVYTGVDPGDALTFGQPASDAPTGTVTFTGVEKEGAVDYFFAFGCPPMRNFVTPESVSFTLTTETCTDGSVLVAARSADDIIAATGISTVDFSEPVTLPAWTPRTAFELAATDLPAETESVDLQAWVTLGSAKIPGGFGATVTPSAGRASLSDVLAVPAGAGIEAWVNVKRAGYATQASTLLRPYVADLAIDTSDVFMSWVTTPTFDVATRTLSWTMDGTDAADFTVTTIVLRRDGVLFRWSAAFVPTHTEFTLPVLPEPWDDYNPAAGDEAGHDTSFLRTEGLRVDAGPFAVGMPYNSSSVVHPYDTTVAQTSVSLP